MKQEVRAIEFFTLAREGYEQFYSATHPEGTVSYGAVSVANHLSQPGPL